MIGIKLNKFIFISFSTLYKEIVFPNFKIIFSIKQISHSLKLLKSINKSIITFYIFLGEGHFLFYFIFNRYSYMVKYLIKFVVIFNLTDDEKNWYICGLVVSFSLGHDFKILRQNNKCLELFWPYRWSNANRNSVVRHFRQRRVLYNLAINVWKS